MVNRMGLVSQARIKQFITLPIDQETTGAVFGPNTYLLDQSQAAAFKKYALLSFHSWQISTDEIADQDEYREFLRFSSDHDWLTEWKHEPSPKTLLSTSQSISIFENAFLLWDLILRDPTGFEDPLSTFGGASAFLLEIAWFVSQVSEYLEPASRACPNERLRGLFAELLDFEKTHYELLIDDLEISREELANHDPSPGAKAMISHLHYLATKDPLSLAVSLNLFETHEEDRSYLANFYTGLENTMGVQLNGFRHHYLLDLEQGHGEFWRKALLTEPELSYSQVSKILTDLHSTKHFRMIWNSTLNLRMKEGRDMAALLLKPRARHFIRPKAVASGFLFNERT